MPRPSPDPTAQPRGMQRWAKPRESEPLPVRMTQNRIYILPTFFGIGMALFLTAITLSALNNSNNHALMFSVSAAAMLVVSLLQTHHRLASVRILSVHAFPAHAQEGVVVRVSMDHLGKKARKGLRLSMGSAGASFDLPAGEPHSIDLRLDGLPRGIHPMGRLRLSTVRPMNIAKAWAWVWPQESFLVYPALETPTPPIKSTGEEEQSFRSTRQGEQVHHLRDWREGDAIRDVAWKATARQGKLVSREYEDQHSGQVRICWEDVAHLSHEQALSRLASWVVQADERREMSELVLPFAHIGPSQGMAHRHACLSALATVPRHADS